MQQQISSYLVKLRQRHPFLATLSMYADYRFNDQFDKFATDGRLIFINPDYFDQRPDAERGGLLLHVTLHCALLHASRCGARDRQVWNVAADIVVNNIIHEAGTFVPPAETAQEPRYADLSVEQVYERLIVIEDKLARSCDRRNTRGRKKTAMYNQTYQAVTDLQPADSPNPSANRAGDAYWRNAMQRACTLKQLHEYRQGELPAGLRREIKHVFRPQLDWRVMLWRFLSKTPCDYQGFDRRFMHCGLYLDQLHGETLNVHIGVDTSGSISGKDLARFSAEVRAITRSYDLTNAQLYFVDAEVHGPYPLQRDIELDNAVGGGGTDFRPFFNAIDKHLEPFETTLAVYLTDGYGDFPDRPPPLPVLWVVPPGGADDQAFPFGDVARLI